jgi:hypothetical protein
MRLVSAVFFTSLFLACGSPDYNSNRSVLAGEPSSNGRYPIMPEQTLTPGDTCDNPDEFRYKEKIAYCKRDVESSRKYAIMREYDAKFGYEITRMQRMDFKIDHFIPLCMGGSNENTNLWPQHKTVYEVTDPLEGELCELMKAGQLLQVDAIATIKKAKYNLSQVASIRASINER